MSWKDEEIDKLYQESAKTGSFEYKNEYWTEMEALLPKSTGKDFLWFFTAFVFIGLIGVTTVIDNPISINDSRIAQSTIQNQTTTESENRSTFNKKNVNSTSSENSNAINFIQKEQSTPASIYTKKEEQSNYIAPKETKPSFKSTIDNSLKNEHKNVSSDNANGGITLATTDEVQNSSSNKREQSNNVDSQEAKPSFKSTIDNTLINEHKNVSSDNAKERITLATTDEVQISNSVNNKTNNEIGNLPIRILDISSSERDIIASPPYEGKTSSYVDFYAQAIGGVSQSLSIPSDKYSYSYGIGLGAQFHKDQFKFTTGVNAFISNHNDLQLNRTAKVYGFGSDVFNYNIDYKKIYSVELLLEAGYQFGRHQVSVGLRPSFAFNSKVQFSELSMDGTQSVVKNSESRDIYGYMDGINQFGLKPMLGYSFNLTPSILIGANVGIQLMPSINEEFINGSNRVYPIDGQIYLRKSFSIRR